MYKFHKSFDFCILLGSDYAIFNHGLKPNEIYELILKYNSIEKICQEQKISCLDSGSLEFINRLRNIYKQSDVVEKEMFLNKNMDSSSIINKTLFNVKPNINLDSNLIINPIIDLKNYLYYSNIMLEFWEDYINLLSMELTGNEENLQNLKIKGDNYKFSIYKFVSKSKFNIKNIVKFIKNNINDITDDELSNMIVSFDYLNTFGI